jgi:hypothetical protein
LAAFAFYKLKGNPLDPIDRGKEPVANEYLGQSKTHIIQKYGSPTKEWSGHYGKPPVDYIKQHSPSVTMVYHRFTGTLYISFEWMDDDWVCYASHWVPNGVILD